MSDIADLFTRWQFYFTQDPTGQKILLGFLVIAALVGLFFALITMKWAARHWKEIFAAAVVLAGLFYLAIWVLNFGWIGILVAAVVCIGMLLGLAQFLTKA